MPLPKPLAELKKDLEEQIGSDLAAAVKTTQGFLSDNQDKRSQTILLEGRLSQIVRDMGTGIIKTEDYQLEVARIRKALLDLVGGLDESDFTPGSPGPASAPVAAVPKFVIIYDQADEQHATMLNRHLNVLKITKKIRVYNVNETLGEGLIDRAKQEMEDADYLLVLITVNLFNSPDWFELVYNAMGEGQRIIPVRIEKADFEGTGLEKLKSLPSMNRAVSEFGSKDDAYMDIVTELRKLLPR
ncbi:MAG: hypothetical protein H6565_11320 [Lewinellaceae bacterium]|nr:hypothetical protein [Lewinellaceae bacterium]